MKSKRGALGLTQSQLLSIVLVAMILIILFSIVSAVLNPDEIQQQFLMKDTAYLVDALHAVPYVTQVSYSSPSQNSFVSVSTNKIKISSFDLNKDDATNASYESLEQLQDLYSIYTKSFWASTLITVKPAAYLHARSFSFLKTSSSLILKNDSFDYSFVQDMLANEKVNHQKKDLHVTVVVDAKNNPLMQPSLDELSRTITAQLQQDGFNQPDASKTVVLRLSFMDKDADLAYKTQLFYSLHEKELSHQYAKSLITYLEPRIVVLRVPQKLSSATTQPTIEIAFANSQNSLLSSKLLESTNELKGFKQVFAKRVVHALEEVVA
ncbi:MAG: hypothetical protein ACLFNM_00175 [Candidatus Woesearchaeota archaeon]